MKKFVSAGVVAVACLTLGTVAGELPLIGPGGVTATPATPPPAPVALFALQFKGVVVPLYGNFDLTEFQGSVVTDSGGTMDVRWMPRTTGPSGGTVDVLNIKYLVSGGELRDTLYWDYVGDPVVPTWDADVGLSVGEYKLDESGHWVYAQIAGPWGN